MADEHDVVYYFDDQGRACVDIFAKALSILDGDKPDCWKYEEVIRHDKNVHYAEMLSDTQLQVQGQHPPVHNLTPGIHYKVLFELSLNDNASGFDDVDFQLHDQDGNLISEFNKKLIKGQTMKVSVGNFKSVAGSQDVKVKMSNFDGKKKSGLVVRCVTITPDN